MVPFAQRCNRLTGVMVPVAQASSRRTAQRTQIAAPPLRGVKCLTRRGHSFFLFLGSCHETFGISRSLVKMNVWV